MMARKLEAYQRAQPFRLYCRSRIDSNAELNCGTSLNVLIHCCINRQKKATNKLSVRLEYHSLLTVMATSEGVNAGAKGCVTLAVELMKPPLIVKEDNWVDICDNNCADLSVGSGLSSA